MKRSDSLLRYELTAGISVKFWNVITRSFWSAGERSGKAVDMVRSALDGQLF